MRNSTACAIATVICTIWCITTVCAITYGQMAVTYLVEYLFHAVPFIAFVLFAVLYSIELRKEIKLETIKIEKENGKKISSN